MKSNPKGLSIGRHIVIVTYLLALGAVQIMIVFVDAEVGLIADSVLLFLLLTHYTFSPWLHGDARDVLIVLCLIPLARIASLVLPQGGISTAYWEALVLFPIIISVGLVARVVDRSWLKLNMGKTSWWVQGVIGLSAIPLSFGLFRSDLGGVIDEFESPRLVAQGVYVLLISGMTIEVIFRGLVQSALTVVFGRAGVLLASGAFAVVLVGTDSAANVAVAAGLGLGFGVIAERTGSVVGVGTAHGLLGAGSIVWPEFL
jgi:uncharacterized protein